MAEKTVIERAMDLLAMVPPPIDLTEQLEALEAEANEVEKGYFPDIWEAVIVSTPPQPK